MSRRSSFVSALLLLAACSPTVSASDEWPGERDRAAATARRIELEWPLAGAGAVSDYLRALGAELSRATERPRARWRFTVVRDRAANAFAIGDGRVYVTEGVIAACDNEAEVAAILTHEMGHQLAGHLRPEREPAGFFGGDAEARSVGSVLQPLEPVKELEADRLSISLLERAGYDPHAALTIAERLAASGGGEHFGQAQRVARLRAALDGVPHSGTLDSRAFRKLKATLEAAP